MAVARVQVVHAAADSGSSISSGNFGASCTAGDQLIVYTRSASGTHDTLSDTLGTSFTKDATNTTQDPCMSVWRGVLTASGTNAVTITFSGSVNFIWIYAINISGADGTVSDITAGALTKTGSGTVSCVSDAVSTSSAGGMWHAASQNAFTTFTGNSPFTLIENFGTGSGNFGAVQEDLTAGAQTGLTAELTSNGSGANFTTAINALKVAAAVAGYLLVKN